ncbi:hypothetical protein D770_05330 [Flammeovirgaceae bacterium 311]|nr:hypothetical protein D770_05330 [Flammeovirgaceae bacterium 311]
MLVQKSGIAYFHQRDAQSICFIQCALVLIKRIVQVINLSHDGQLKQSQIDYLGGNFGWLAVLRMGGVGSSKFIYESGIEGFDQLKELTTASNYINLELLKKGLAIRFKKQNSFKACLLRYDGIKVISVVSQKILVYYRGRPKIVHQADIDIVLNTGIIKVKLHPTYYEAGMDFLKKNILKGRCKFILLPDIIDEQNLDVGVLVRIISKIN